MVIYDGSNFYHRAKKLAPYLHLTNFNYRKLADQLTGSLRNDIEYCVGEIKPQAFGEQKASRLYSNQQKLFYNLQKQGIVIKKGFMMKQGSYYHEKGVDVRIASDIIRGALKNEYNTCFVISSDSDILPAIQEAISAGKEVVYVCFERSVLSRALYSNCSRTIQISENLLQICSG